MVRDFVFRLLSKPDRAHSIRRRIKGSFIVEKSQLRQEVKSFIEFSVVGSGDVNYITPRERRLFFLTDPTGKGKAHQKVSSLVEDEDNCCSFLESQN